MFEFQNEFILFEDCIHSIFKDSSALILHDGIITYFNSKGERNRIKIDNCRKSDNLYNKVQEVLQIAAIYSSINPNQIEYEEAVKMKKIQTIIWPLQPVVEKNFAILKSIDGFAQIKLNLDNFEVLLSYYSCKQTVAVVKEVENQTDYMNNFFQKYNLGSTKQSIDCSIGYTYRKINKIFSLINFPQQWIAPFFILVKDYLGHEKCKLSFKLVSLLDIKFPTELIEYLLTEQEEISEYFLKTHSCYRLKDQLITTVLDEQTKVCKVNDTVSPIMNKISQINLGKPIFMMTKEAKFWFQQNAGIGTLKDQLLLRDGIFWELGQQKWEQSIYNDRYQLSSFDVYCKHVNKFNEQPSQQLQAISFYQVEQGNFDQLKKVEIRDVGEFVVLKNGTVKAKFIDRTVITFKYPPPCNIRIISQLGESGNVDFEPIQDEKLYKTYNHYLDYFQPELQLYMQYCLKVAEECFAIPEVFTCRETHQQQLSNWIDQEMERNQRFLILSGKYSYEEQPIQQESTLDDQIQMLLTANERMLKKLKE